MNTLVATCVWVPFLLTGCDFLLPPCTSFKQKVCACDEAGEVMCETAKVAEDKAKEYKDDEDEARYDSAQDACETLLDTWKEADGCSQFDDQDNDANWDEENTESDPPIDGDVGNDENSPVGENASLNCEAECIFNVACYGVEPNTCNDDCLQIYAEEYGLCDGPEAGAYAGCVIEASATCDENAYDTCIGDYPNAMTLCN